LYIVGTKRQTLHVLESDGLEATNLKNEHHC